ncbi:MAG TPA: hypothetical protein VF765_08935 [Polyangiaceae bacterium]
MSRRLHPCPSCEQHVRASETRCPFCDAPLPAGFGAIERAPVASDASGHPLSRAALLFVGATTAAACGGKTQTTPESTGPSDAGGDVVTSVVASSEGGGGGGTVPEKARDAGRPEVSADASTDAPADAPSDARGSDDATAGGWLFPAPPGPGGGQMTAVNYGPANVNPNPAALYGPANINTNSNTAYGPAVVADPAPNENK